MISQTLLPFECIVVCDGRWAKRWRTSCREYEGRIRTVRLPKCRAGACAAGGHEGMQDGAGAAHGQRRWRCRAAEKQMAFMCAHPEIDVISCAIKEFCGDTESDFRSADAAGGRRSIRVW